MHTSVNRIFELDHPGGFASSPWAAVLGHHHTAAAAAAAAAAGTMMQTGDHHAYGGTHHPAAPMDLHMPQAFPYYRWVEKESFLWTPTSRSVSFKSIARYWKNMATNRWWRSIDERFEQLNDFFNESLASAGRIVHATSDLLHSRTIHIKLLKIDCTIPSFWQHSFERLIYCTTTLWKYCM